MYYRENLTLNYSACRGTRNGTDLMMFDSHTMGKLKGLFSKYEQYNDSNVSISISAGYYDLRISVSSNLDKGDSWCNNKLREAMDYVKDIVINGCRSNSGQLEITIELNAN